VKIHEDHPTGKTKEDNKTKKELHRDLLDQGLYATEGVISLRIIRSNAKLGGLSKSKGLLQNENMFSEKDDGRMSYFQKSIDFASIPWETTRNPSRSFSKLGYRVFMGVARETPLPPET
jgi:hypothetical protein